MGTKKSNFSALSTIAAGSTFDFVINGQNFKITKEDLVTALGVAGTIEQTGDVTSVPVLDGTPGDYLIRNLVSGDGIDVVLTAENGIQFNLASDLSIGTLQQVTESGNVTTNDIILKDADLVYQDASGAFIGLGAIRPENIVNVTSEDDFPDPVGGISSLEEKVYLISSPGLLEVSFRIKFVSSRTVLLGFGRLYTFLRFTNTSATDANIISTPGVHINVTNLLVESPNAPMFDVDGSAISLFTVDNCILDNCSDLGKLTGFVRLQINNGTLIGFSVTGGFDILGTTGTVLIQDVQSGANSAAPTFDMTDAGLTVNRLSMTNITATQLTGTNKFADIDPTKVTSALIADSAFSSTDPLGTAINNTTPNFIIDRVAGVEETRKIGTVSLTAPFTVTIASISTPVELGGTWSGSNLSQFSVVSPGIQYDGLDFGDIFKISAIISGTRPGGTGSDTYTGSIYINDVLVPGSTTFSEVSDKGGSLVTGAFTSLSTGDHITLYVSNETSTVDLDAVSAKIDVSRVS